MRRRGRTRFSPDDHLWQTEYRYEIVRDDVVIVSEDHRRSPAGRWYTQAEATRIYGNTVFQDVQLFRGFTRTPASSADTGFCVLGVKREAPL